MLLERVRTSALPSAAVVRQVPRGLVNLVQPAHATVSGRKRRGSRAASLLGLARFGGLSPSDDGCCVSRKSAAGGAVSRGNRWELLWPQDREGLRRPAAISEDHSMSSRVDRLAELAVGVGANVQPGQDVAVLAFDVEQAPVARAVADAAYLRGPLRHRFVLGSAR